MIAIYEDSPLFVDGVEFSGIDGNTLRTNAIFLEAITQQPIYVFPQGLYKETYIGMPTTGANTANVWRGSFRMDAGIDTATYVISGVPVTNERLRIYHKKLEDAEPGTLVHDVVWPSSATVSIDLSSAGYSLGDIIETTVQVYFPGTTPKTGAYFVRRATTGPVSDGIGAYPGLPTFGAGSTVTETNLNLLSNAQDWIMNRLALVPRIPFEAGMFVLGSHRSDAIANPRLLYLGWMNRGNGQDTFHGVIDYFSFNGQETIKVYIGGILQYTSATLTNGQKGTLDFTFDVSSFTAGADYTVRIEQEIPVGQAQADLALYGQSIIASRFTLRKLEVTAARAYTSAPTEFDILESMAYSTLKSRLTTIKNITAAAKTRIDSSSILFDEARMFRKKFGWDSHQVTSLEWVNLPTQVRIGERFVVAGQDVKLAWGGHSLTKNLIEEPAARDIYEFANVESLTGSDKIEVKEGYFEEFEGLFPGTQYYLIGKEINFFAEYLR